MKYKSIHMTGVCGIAMGTLAQMLCDRGFSVTGSDSDIYPPMSDQLKNSGVKLIHGYDAKNVASADLVIIGNAISRGNPEVEELLNSGMPRLSMAGALRDFFLKDKEVIVVAGTHGKTTTTALTAHILQTAGLDPSFFVGGVANNSGSSYRLGNGRHFIIEGDEYDSSFFEKVPKFIFYKPNHLVVTSLEFDHADIYKNLDEIELWFKRLVNIVPSNGFIGRSSDYDILNSVVQKSFSRNYTFGGTGSDYAIEFSGYDGSESILVLRHHGDSVDLRSGIFGQFNYINIAAAASIALSLGIDVKSVQEGIRTFKGVRRRQELIYDKGNVKVFEDFAHHPTAIKGMLETFRERFNGSTLWAVYEPRSATSRRNVFQRELPGAFRPADRILIKSPYQKGFIPDNEKMDIGRVRDDIVSHGGDASVFENTDDIVSFITKEIDKSRKNVILIMSNGGFDGIYGKIKSEMDRVIL